MARDRRQERRARRSRRARAAVLVALALPLGGAGCGADAATGAGSPGTYGTDPTLDALWRSCAGGDLADCDGLLAAAPMASQYQQYGSTCGWRRWTSEPCTTVFRGSLVPPAGTQPPP